VRFFYAVHGLVIGSEFELPELEARRSVATGEPDVRVAIGKIPAPLLARSDAAYLETGSGRGLIDIPEVGRFYVVAGRAVTVEPAARADPALVRLFILGSVIGLLCHQRGLLPLHAGAVEVNGVAVAFVGHEGQGKSTLTAHCLSHPETRLIADDILVVRFDSLGRAWAQPGMPILKLWRDALQQLGQNVDGLQEDWFRADKFHLPIVDRLIHSPVPLNRVYVLADDDNAGAGRIEPMTGVLAAVALIAHTYRAEFLESVEQRPAHFAASIRLANAVSVRWLARYRELAQVKETVLAIFADLPSATRSNDDRN
jgi:hypothetical protein